MNSFKAHKQVAVIGLAALILCGYSLGESFSRKEISVNNPQVSDSPIELIDVEAFLLFSKNRTSSGPAGKVQFIMKNQVVGWASRIQYRNAGNKRLIATSFQWSFFDAFGRLLGTAETLDDRILNPRQKHEKEWEQPGMFADAVSASVIPIAVRFEDDSIWTANPKEFKDPIIQGAIQAERERLLKIYQSDGIDTLIKELQEKK